MRRTLRSCVRARNSSTNTRRWILAGPQRRRDRSVGIKSAYASIAEFIHGLTFTCSPIAAALAESLAPPPKDSIGAKILKKMGWKVGQGIGPRLTYTQRRALDAGFLDPAKEVEGNEEDPEEAKRHLYPRKDTPLLLLPRKDNFHGLGYTPGLGLIESIGSERARTDLNISCAYYSLNQSVSLTLVICFS